MKTTETKVIYWYDEEVEVWISEEVAEYAELYPICEPITITEES